MSSACMYFGVALPRHYSPADAYLTDVPAALRRLAEHVEVAQLRATVVAPYVALVQKGALLGNAARLLRTRAKYRLLDAAGTAALAALGHKVPSFRTTCRWMDAYLCNGLPGLLPPGYPIEARSGPCAGPWDDVEHLVNAVIQVGQPRGKGRPKAKPVAPGGEA